MTSSKDDHCQRNDFFGSFRSTFWEGEDRCFRIGRVEGIELVFSGGFRLYLVPRIVSVKREDLLVCAAMEFCCMLKVVFHSFNFIIHLILILCSDVIE